MAGKKTTIGPTGESLSANVKRLREGQNLSFAEMSRRLAACGRPIPELGLRHIERGQRKVDVDELTALAIVLKTTPAYLLIRDTANHDDPVKVTGANELPAIEVWGWLTGNTSTLGGSGRTDSDLQTFLNSEPRWRLELFEEVVGLAREKNMPPGLERIIARHAERRGYHNGND